MVRSTRLSTIVEDLVSRGFSAVASTDVEIVGVSAISGPRDHSLTYWRYEVPIPEDILRQLPESVVLAISDPELIDTSMWSGVLLICSDPRAAFAFAARRVSGEVAMSGVHPSSVVDESARIDETAYIGPMCVIGRASIGANVIIEPGCVIGDNVVVLQDVQIGAHCVIGGVGFGYVRTPKGESIRVPHLGGVVIHRGAHLGSLVAVDRGTVGDTIIGEEARIDNLVHVAHNVRIGARAMIIAGAEISGSVIIGEDCWVAPQACIREKLVIGSRSVIGLGSVVVKDVPEESTVMGNPARPVES